jgi:N-acetylglucosaminyldiphosphoundecaprenol N-acetyl-beta-D-mannosaminyltransferase
MNKVKILNLEIDNLSKAEFLEKLQSGVVFTPNVDHLIKLQKDPEFLQAYSICDYKVCDSQILIYASKFLGTPIKEKISGSDLFPAFYNYHRHNQDIKIFLLGAGQGIASKAQNEINRKTGRNIIIASYSPSFGFEKDEQECQNIIRMINNSGATVLAIGVGAPKQEKWIYKYKHLLPHIKIFMAVGATIDFEAGNVKRAPKWVSEVGLEWMYRLLCEPKRLWKRYLVDDIPFLILILKQKLNLYLKKEPKNSNPIWQVADRL